MEPRRYSGENQFAALLRTAGLERGERDSAGSQPDNAAIAAGGPPTPPNARIGSGCSEEDRRLLLELARTAMIAAVNGLAPPEFKPLTPTLEQHRSCFITRTTAGELRGCIGSLIADVSLAKAVLNNVASAALCDPRFPPVEPVEVAEIQIEISVMSEPRALKVDSAEELLSRLRPGLDGVLLKMEGRLGTFLPQVWADLPDKVQFMERLARKAGLEPGAWRRPEAQISVYEVESIAESEG
jgi:AmmeMemoRadiSam system protein A